MKASSWAPNTWIHKSCLLWKEQSALSNPSGSGSPLLGGMVDTCMSSIYQWRGKRHYSFLLLIFNKDNTHTLTAPSELKGFSWPRFLFSNRGAELGLPHCGYQAPINPFRQPWFPLCTAGCLGLCWDLLPVKDRTPEGHLGRATWAQTPLPFAADLNKWLPLSLSSPVSRECVPHGFLGGPSPSIL